MVRSNQHSGAKSTAARESRIYLVALLVLLLTAFAVRVKLLSQSLWYDEIYTVTHFVGQPYSEIVAGKYSPNNHILSSLLIRTCEQVGSHVGIWNPLEYAPQPDGVNPLVVDMGTLRFRLPAIIAGTLAAWALAWPLRRQKSGDLLAPFGVLLAIAAVQPWLLVFSTEARGYGMALAWTLLATNCLTGSSRRRWVIYVVSMIGAIYTIPLAAAILAGHGAALFLLHRRDLKPWAVCTGIIVAGSLLVYGPFWGQMAGPARQMSSELGYVEFLGQSLRHAVTGWNTLGIWSLALAVISLVAGLPLAWREARLRVLLVSFAVASVVALGAPLVVPATAQARFAFWLVPVVALAWYGILMEWPATVSRRRTVRIVTATATAGWMIWQMGVLTRVPPQPVLDAILLLDQESPPHAPVVGLYLGTFDSYKLYAPFFGERSLVPVMIPSLYTEALRQAAGREIWTLVIYPEVLHRDAPALEEMFLQGNECVADLPGRYSHVQIYRSRRSP